MPTIAEPPRENSIPLTQVWSRLLALEHVNLVAQDDKLQPKVLSRPQESGKPTEETQDEAEHGSSLHDRVVMIGLEVRGVNKSLIPWANQILATNTNIL